MKKILSVSMTVIMTFIFISIAAAEKPCQKEGEGPGWGMQHKDLGMLAGTRHLTGHHEGIGGITLHKLMRLDLSDAQKKEVANILAAHRDDSHKLVDQLMKEKEAYIDAIHSTKPFDESAVRQSFQQMSATMENLVVQRSKIFSELKPVLNKDQLKDLAPHHRKKSDHKQKRGEMKKRLDVHRDMMDTWINTYADDRAKGK